MNPKDLAAHQRKSRESYFRSITTKDTKENKGKPNHYLHSRFSGFKLLNYQITQLPIYFDSRLSPLAPAAFISIRLYNE